MAPNNAVFEKNHRWPGYTGSDGTVLQFDVLTPLTEWDSMLTQCSCRVFQQHKAAGYTIFR